MKTISSWCSKDQISSDCTSSSNSLASNFWEMVRYQKSSTTSGKWYLGYSPRGPRFGLRSTALSMKVWIVTEPPITRIWWPFSSLTHRFFNSGYCCRFKTFELTRDEKGSLQPWQDKNISWLHCNYSKWLQPTDVLSKPVVGRKPVPPLMISFNSFQSHEQAI